MGGVETAQGNGRTAERETIENFLADELAELRVKRRAKFLMTTPKEIAERTGLDPQVVKKSLSMIAEEKQSAKVVVVRVGKTDVVVRLAD
ncbi:unnamed protein product [marine sediment metagenome]|uniref:Uncharacterized protein n=1 Tax=marine sediment metagenome TaxID=412755 RepID=X1MSP1_9ZZZZ